MSTRSLHDKLNVTECSVTATWRSCALLCCRISIGAEVRGGFGPASLMPSVHVLVLFMGTFLLCPQIHWFGSSPAIRGLCYEWQLWGGRACRA